MRRFHRTIIGFVVGFAFILIVILDLAFFTLQIIFAGNAGAQTEGLIWLALALVSFIPQYVALHLFQERLVPWVDKPDKPQNRTGSRMERS